MGFAPPSGVVPPPAPPIQPAPPGGARREAKAKQPAAAKSEEGSSEAKEQVADPMNQPPGPTGTEMTRRTHPVTRRDRTRPTGSITPIHVRAQPSAWTRGLEWGGGLTLMALVLAFGYTTVRPTPRRRTPPVAAPAWARRRPRR
jgi:hypothetical protein